MERRIGLAAALVALVFLAGPASAQFLEKWGEFGREELFSLHYAEDPEADAVVLSDRAIARVDRRHRLFFQRHTRTKIFTEAGASRGVIRIEYGKDDKVRDLRGHTVVPPGKEIKLEKKHVTEEKLGDRRVTTIRFPDVRPGVILELAYELRTDDLSVLPPWHFQHDDYTRESRFELQVPAGMTYDTFFGWTPGPAPKPVKRTVLDPEHSEFTLEEAGWTMSAIPGFRRAPLMANDTDFRIVLFVQLMGFDSSDSRQSQVVQAGQFESSNLKTMTLARPWPEIGADVSRMQQGILKNATGVQSWAAPAVEGISEPEARARALYRHVRDEIRSVPRAGAPTSPADAVASGQASPAGKNLLLLRLLNDEKIDADAVLIRTRDDGTFQPRYHDAGQLNHTILRVSLGSQVHWLDASPAYCPFGVLPPRALVEEGLRIRDDAGAIVAIDAPPVESLRSVTTEAKLANQGGFTSKSTFLLTGYEALRARQHLADHGEEAFVQELLGERLSSATLKSAEVRGRGDASAPLEIEVKLDRSGVAERKGTTVRLSSPFLIVPPRNPLSASEREYPLEYPYTWTFEERVTVSLTPGSRVLRAPENVRRQIAEAEFSFLTEPSQEKIETSCKLALRTPTVAGQRYDEVRAFYDELVTAGAGRFVVKPPPTSVSGTR